MTDLFQVVPGNSPLHRMNPVTKIFSAEVWAG